MFDFINVAKVASKNLRSSQACKDKWVSLYADYKRIKDYKHNTGYNEEYFNMSAPRRKELGLPMNLQQVHYNQMDRFLTQRSCLNPPHACGLLGERDKLYSGTQDGDNGVEEDDDLDADNFMPDERDSTLVHGPGRIQPTFTAHYTPQPRPTNPNPLGKGKGYSSLNNKRNRGLFIKVKNHREMGEMQRRAFLQSHGPLAPQ